MNGAVTIARTDIVDQIRSNTVWAAVGLMTALVLANWAAGADVITADDRPFLMVVGQFQLWLPLFAIAIGYNAVVGERVSGRLRTLLGQPGTRRGVVFGKFLARAIIFLLSVTAVLLVVSVLVVVRIGAVDLLEFVAGTLTVMLYGLAWLGATVGISALAADGNQVLGIMLVCYVLVLPLWLQFVGRLLALVTTGTPDVAAVIDTTSILTYADGPVTFLYAYRLSPAESFISSTFYLHDLLSIAVRDGTTTAAHGPNQFGFAVLLAWTVVPLTLGYWWFDRIDLR